MTDKQKKMRLRIIIALVIYGLLVVLQHVVIPESFLTKLSWFILYVIPYLIAGYDIIWKALRNIVRGQVFDECFLMMIATFGGFAVGEFSESVAVMLFYQVGELFQSYAVGKSRQSITELMDICPEYANIEVDGQLQQVDPDDVKIGQIIVIKPGEKVPLDGVVVSGSSLLDTKALTGESVPRQIHEGEEIISGCVNGEGTLQVRVTKEFDDSTVARILELVENASSKKAKMENFITRFARYYTPVVTIGAAFLAVIPPLILHGGWSDWILRACIFLVISCPCALVISVPMGFFGGIGAASKKGILVKGSNYLEVAASLRTVVFDKTGTLTKGQFKVVEVAPQQVSKDELVEIAALAESYSNHPIARSIEEAYAKTIDTSRVVDVKEIAGHGLSASVDGHTTWVGNYKLMESENISYVPCEEVGTIVYVADDRGFLGYIRISDVVKEGAVDAINDMKQAGVDRCIMLTGDQIDVAEKVAGQLHLDEYHAELLPADKLTKIEKLISAEREKEKLAFVGDGINDAPVLTRADVGFAMGSLGSDAAIEAADIVIMDDDLEKIPAMIRIAKKTIRIVKENIVFALAVKIIVLILGALGVANMWGAVFADVGVSVLAILNAMRALQNNE